MIRRIDLLSRTAFGGLCIAGMSLEAVPVLIVVGPVGGIAAAINGSWQRALGVWLGSWAAAGFAAMLFLAIAYFFWPLASDWITEWKGYVAGFVIGGIGLTFMAIVVLFTGWPLAIELIFPFAITFLVGFLLPGWVLGLGAHSALPQERARAAKQRGNHR